jgi:integrase
LIPTKRFTIASNSDIMSKTELKEVTIYHETANWSLSWYGQNADGKPIRLRQTFNLNRLHDLVHRGQRAKYLAEILKKFAIHQGYPIKKTPYDAVLNHAPSEWLLAEAVRYACDLKVLQSTRSRTHETFQMYARVFVENFLFEMGWLNMKLSDFGRKDAQRFLDWLTEGGTKRASSAALRGKAMQGATLNNYRQGMRSLFFELVRRELIEKNVWGEVKTVETQEAIRRPMTETERDLIFKALYNEHPFLLLGVLFQYHCAVRPAEIRRLKFRMIDLDAGLIHLTADETKNKRRGAITIPKSFIEILRAYSIQTFPPDWWIFGYLMNPHDTIQCGQNSLSTMHRIVLKRLNTEGVLPNIEGLQFYSWKDTGGIDMVNSKIDIDEIRKHFRHASLDYTQRYLRKKQSVIASIRDRESNLADVTKIKEKLLDFASRKKK